jgi:hypothetical protein
MNGLKVAVMIAASALLACSSGHGTESARVPTLADIQDVESHLRLPAAAAPLKTYTREYAGRVESGHHIVVGDLFGTGGHIVIDKSTDVPDDTFDGGCGIINVKYDLTAHKLLRLECHGRVMFSMLRWTTTSKSCKQKESDGET